MFQSLHSSFTFLFFFVFFKMFLFKISLIVAGLLMLLFPCNLLTFCSFIDFFHSSLFLLPLFSSIDSSDFLHFHIFCPAGLFSLLTAPVCRLVFCDLLVRQSALWSLILKGDA